jgi:nuclear GTP-binding protein
LSREYPTLAFHASMNNPFGKGALIQLLRQFSKLHADKKQISVGMVGYPNVGKSSLINTLRKKKVCKVAPIPGETKVWQYITLMKKIYLIDCPGIVYPSEDTEVDIVLKGVVRIENIKEPQDPIPEVLRRVKIGYLKRTYELNAWKDPTDFLSQIARKTGKLLKGGEPDLNTVAKRVLNDWLRGRLPYFTLPPEDGEKTGSSSILGSDTITHQDLSEIQMSTEFANEDLSCNREISTTENTNSVASILIDSTVSLDSAITSSDDRKTSMTNRMDPIPYDSEPDTNLNWESVYETIVGRSSD